MHAQWIPERARRHLGIDGWPRGKLLLGAGRNAGVESRGRARRARGTAEQEVGVDRRSDQQEGQAERGAEGQAAPATLGFDTLSHCPRILAKSPAIAQCLESLMPESFSPTHSVRFELGRGRVSVDGADARVLIPADALAKLCAGAGHESIRDFGHRLGTEMGRRVAGRVGARASVPTMVEHLGGDLAVAGFGSLAAEVWGRALVLTITDSPFGGDGDVLLAAVLEGALQRALGRDTSIVPIERDGEKVRLVVVSPGAAVTLRKWLQDGVTWGDALTRLNASV
jgi:hypothetical protein